MGDWPKVSIDTTKNLDMCFACGWNNPIGLKLSFEWDDKTAKTEFTPTEFHQGWSGIVHGGIIQCLLDEAMGYATRFEGLDCLTVEMHARLKRPALINEPLIITSSVIKKTRRLIKTKAAISLKDGTLVAEGTAKHFVVNQKSRDTSHDEEEPKGNA